MNELLERANELVKRLRSDMDAIKDVVNKVSVFDLAFDGKDGDVRIVTIDPIETSLVIPSSVLLDSMGGRSEVRNQLRLWVLKYSPIQSVMDDSDYATLEFQTRRLVSRIESKINQINELVGHVADGYWADKHLETLGEDLIGVVLAGWIDSPNRVVYTVAASSLVKHQVAETEQRERALEECIAKWEAVVMPVATAIRQEREIDKLIGEIEAAAKEQS